MSVALVVGCAVCTALSTSGAFITDLKVGYWLGASPFQQQRWKYLGIVVAALCLVTCCIVLIPYVGTVILLPAWVLYRIYSVEFLAQFHPDFDVFTGVPAVTDETELIGENSEANQDWTLPEDD